MATNQVQPNQTAGSVLRNAIAKNQANGASPAPVAPVVAPVARMTESGTPQATKGVSLQDQMADMVAKAVAAALANGASPARGAKAPKAVKAPKPVKAPESGPWYARSAFLGRVDKATGAPFYDVDFDSVLATDDVAIMRSNAFSNTLLFIKGKRKPIYLSAGALAVLITSHATLTEFSKVNAAYLAQCIADHKAEAESSE